MNASGAPSTTRRPPSFDIFLVAGEVSGDIHGANLVASLKRRLPHARFRGVGGDRMAAQGVDLRFHISDLGVVGIVEVARHLPHILAVHRALREELTRDPPTLLILIDYPDFNLRLANHAHRERIPVIYYISPQVWAWRRGRVRSMARYVDLMLVIFPFEETFYQRAGVPVRFIGHPLMDAHAQIEPARDLQDYELEPDRPIVALLPGSRSSETRLLLDPFLRACELLAKKRPDCQFVLIRAEGLRPGAVESAVDRATIPIRMAPGPALSLLPSVSFAITASGTATLDLALSGVPMAVCYRISPMTYALAKMLVKVDHIGLVNIVAGRRLVPELIQNDMTSENIVAAALPMLSDGEERRRVVDGLNEVRRRMGAPGASDRAALEIARFIADRKLWRSAHVAV